MKKIVFLCFVFILNCTFLCAKDARSTIEKAIKEFQSSDTSDATNLGEHFVDKYIDMDAVTILIIPPKMRDALAKDITKVRADIKKRVAYTLGQKLKAGKNATIAFRKDKDEESKHDPVLKKKLTMVPIVITSTKYGKINVDLYVDDTTGLIATARIDETFEMTKTFKDEYKGLWERSNGNPKTFMENLRK